MSLTLWVKFLCIFECISFWVSGIQMALPTVKYSTVFFPPIIYLFILLFLWTFSLLTQEIHSYLVVGETHRPRVGWERLLWPKQSHVEALAHSESLLWQMWLVIISAIKTFSSPLTFTPLKKRGTAHVYTKSHFLSSYHFHRDFVSTRHTIPFMEENT